MLQITTEACKQHTGKHYWEFHYRAEYAEVSVSTEKEWVSHLSPQTTLMCLKHFTLN